MPACPILFSNTAEWLKITVLSFNTFCLFRFSSDFCCFGRSNFCCFGRSNYECVVFFSG